MSDDRTVLVASDLGAASRMAIADSCGGTIHKCMTVHLLRAAYLQHYIVRSPVTWRGPSSARYVQSHSSHIACATRRDSTDGTALCAAVCAARSTDDATGG